MRKVFLFLLFFILVSAGKSFAQTPSPSSNQISVFPSVIQLDLAVASPQATLTYKNMTDKTVELSLQAQNFTELEDGYKVNFMEGKDAANYRYGLSSWVHFGNSSLLLDPGESKDVTLFIDKDKLTPGGHYATILAEINSDSQKTKQVQIKGVLGSLLFVRTNTGKEEENATIASFDTTRNFFDFPDTFYFRLNNHGDTDVVPHGLIQIYGMGNTLIAKGIVNETSAPTLPESIRRYYVAIRNLTPFILPGMYKATLWIHYGKTDKSLQTSFTFFSTGSIPTIIVVGIIVSLTLLVIWFRRKK